MHQSARRRGLDARTEPPQGARAQRGPDRPRDGPPGEDTQPLPGPGSKVVRGVPRRARAQLPQRRARGSNAPPTRPAGLKPTQEECGTAGGGRGLSATGKLPGGREWHRGWRRAAGGGRGTGSMGPGQCGALGGPLLACFRQGGHCWLSDRGRRAVRLCGAGSLLHL